MSNIGSASLNAGANDFVRVALPQIEVPEDLDLDGFGVPGVLDPPAYPRNVGRLVPHHAPVGEKASCEQQPIIEMNPKQPDPTRPAKLGSNTRVPPDMVDIDHYAGPPAGPVAQIVCLGLSG